MSFNEKLIEKFNEMDLDHNGELTPIEVKYILQRDGKFSKESVEEIIKEFDINSDGKITLEEYKEKLNIVDPVRRRYQIWKNVFDSFDLDHSGELELKEIQKILGNDGVGNGYDVSTFENWLSKRDMNRDGKLDYNEFLEFINPRVE